MPEQSEEWAITTTSVPNLPTPKPHKLTQSLVLVEEVLAKAGSPEDALDWARVRDAILRQNEEVKEENHRRFLEKSRFIYGIALSGTAFLVGIVLFICNYENAVYLIVAGLIPLLPRKKTT